MSQPWPPGGPVVSCNWASNCQGASGSTRGVWWRWDIDERRGARGLGLRPKTPGETSNTQSTFCVVSSSSSALLHLEPLLRRFPLPPRERQLVLRGKKCTEHKTLWQKESDPPLKERSVFTFVALQHSAIQTNVKGPIFKYERWNIQILKAQIQILKAPNGNQGLSVNPPSELRKICPCILTFLRIHTETLSSWNQPSVIVCSFFPPSKRAEGPTVHWF